MKISCQSCAAKYTIADEKVSGRIVKIKCKKCASTIVVNGNELVTGGMAAASAHAPMPSLHEIPMGLGQLGSPGAGTPSGDDAQTRVMADVGGGEPPVDEWTVSITDDDQRTMTTEQVVAAYSDGTLTQDTYLWRDGMGDWLPLFEVGELQPFLAAVGEAPPSSASVPLSGGGAHMSTGQSPFDVPSAGAGLFGAGPASASQPPDSTDARHVGERNENSVLFSLSALTAAEDAASKEGSSAPPMAGRSGINLSDLAAPPRPSNGRATRERAGFDDIMNIGGGAIGASPMLAPPDLLAPVREPEPPPPPPAPISQAMPYSSPMMMMPEQKKPMGLFIGIGVAVALVVIVGIVVVTSGGEETKPVAENTSTESADKTDTGTGAATDSTAKPEDESSTATATDSDKTGDETGDKTGDEADDEPGPEATEEQKKAFAEAKKKKAETASEKPEPEADPKTKKKDPVEDTSDKPKAEFSRAAAMGALGGAAGAAQGCAKKGGPTGSGKARVTFAPSGRVTSASIDGPFAGSSVGSCVAGIFRGASVPPFKGGAVTVSKSFRIK